MITILKKDELPDDRYLRMCDPDEVRIMMKSTAEKRSANRIGNRGWSKNKNMRSQADFAPSLYWNPAYWRVFHNPDREEGNRLKKLFIEKHWKLCATTDKL